MYCFLQLRKAKDHDGQEPDAPDEVSFLLLAEVGTSSAYPFALYECTWDTDMLKWEPGYPASGRLTALLGSARRYPPALALARQQI
ncbi:unnamed protein product, partial [Laminaria digitata]